MRITDLLNVESIKLNATPKNKQEAIDELIDLQVKGGKITDREAYKEGILAREAMSTTAVGDGSAAAVAAAEYLNNTEKMKI